MKRSRHAIIYSAMALGLAANSFAAQIDASAFKPGEKTEVSFAGLPFDFGRPGPVLAGGLTFTAGHGSFRTYPASSPMQSGPATQVCAERGCIMTDDELDTITVALPTPVAMAGAYIGITNESTTAIAEFYAGTTLLGSVNISAKPFEGVFAGWDAGSPLITSVKFIDNQNQGFVLGLTGFTYQAVSSVPEAATNTMFLFGIAFTTLFARKRKA